jgi:hypothetical protein
MRPAGRRRHRLCRQAARRRREVELEIYRGLTHDFIKMGRVIKEAALAQGVAAAR